MHGCNSLCSKQDIPCVSNTTNSLCSKHNEFLVFQTQQIPCVPQHFLVFPAEQSLCSQQNNKKSESQFSLKIIEKKSISAFNPLQQTRTELNLSSSGVIFRARRAGNAQKCVAPPKRLIVDWTSNISKKNLKQKFFGAEK